MEKFSIGCYSDSNTSIESAKGKGLSFISLENEKLTIDFTEEGISNPSYIFNINSNQIFVCSEFFNKKGLITIYDYEDKKKLKEIDSKGKATCYVNYDKLTDNIFWTNYLSGSIGLYNIKTHDSDLMCFKGFSINNERQESSHPHCILFNKDYIFVSDLGCDKIYVFDRFYKKFKIVNTINIKPGYGPRHLVYLYNHLYVVCELTPKILSYYLDENTNTWVLKEEINNECDALMNISNPAAIKVIEKDDYSIITSSNRFSDGLRVFKVFKNGELSFIKDLRLKGNNPRDFEFSKDNRFLLVALQDSDCIELYRVDEYGIVEDNLISVLKINTPVCVRNY